MPSVKTACRICSLCGYELEVEDNQILSFHSDTEHPVSEGYCCIKGKAGIELQQGLADRLSTSMKRGSDGALHPVDYQIACREIGQKLSALIEEHGPRAVAMFVGTGAVTNTLAFAFARAWFHTTGSPNYFSTLTIDQSCHNITAGRMGTYLGGEPTPEEVDVALVAGMNPLVSHLGYPLTSIEAMNPGKRLRQAKERGQKLIVIDPRLSETARKADLHLQMIPGEDATLFAGLLYLLFENNWLDKDFCKRYAAGVEALEESVRDYTPDYVAQRCGVEVSELQQAAQLFGNAKRPHAGCSTGTSMTPDSNLADFLMESMNVLKGGYRRAGDPVKNGLPLLSLAPPIADILPPNRTWEHGVKCRTQEIGKLNNEFPSALLADEILKPGEDKIRALLVIGGNPLKALPAPEHNLAALKDLELLVTLDHRLSETAAVSHYALATSTQYERHDLTSVHEIAFNKNFVQYFPPVIEKASSVADDWEVLWEITRAMGRRLEFKYGMFGVDYGDLPGGIALDMQERPDGESLIRTICEQRNIPFDKLKAAPHGLELPESPPVASPQSDSGARLDLCPPDVASDLARLRRRKPSGSPYRLAGRRIISAMNSHYQDSAISRRKYPVNFAFMHPDDMAREKINDGDRINIGSDSGSIVGTVKTDKAVRPGVVSMAHSHGLLDQSEDPGGDQGAFTGHLIPLDADHREPINYMPHMTGVPVNISRFSM